MFSNYSSHASGSSQPPQSHGQPFVTIRHPEYPIENSVLFRLPKLDITIGRDQDSDSDFVGVHHGTVLTACRILVGNDKTAYLSYDQSGKSPVSLDFEGVLCRSEYYLQVKQGIDGKRPYVIVSDFEHWRFPTDGVPKSWSHESFQFDKAAQSKISCIVSDAPTESRAHLIPQGFGAWFRRNEMRRYLSLPTPTSGPEVEQNVCYLRVDLLKAFGERHFVIVPKLTDGEYHFVIHFLSMNGGLEDNRATAFLQNRTIYHTKRLPQEFLYARFAYSIFGLIGDFKAHGGRRLATRIPGRDQKGRFAWVTMVSLHSTPTGFPRERYLGNGLPRKRTSDEAGMSTQGQTILPLRQGFEPTLKLPAPTWSIADSNVLPRPAARRQQGRPLSFNDLPPEIRRIIWEETWPGPQVIRVATTVSVEIRDNFARTRCAYEMIHPCGDISAWLRPDCDKLGSRQMTASPNAIDVDSSGNTDVESSVDIDVESSVDTDVESSGDTDVESSGDPPPPSLPIPRDRQHLIALSINAESRRYTLENFIWIKNYLRPEWSFYYSPKRDVFWLTDNSPARNEHLHRHGLWQFYGQQLTMVRNIIVNESCWKDLLRFHHMGLFGGAKTIRILLENETAPGDVLKLAVEVQNYYGDKSTFYSVFQIVDRMYNVLAEFWI